MNGKLGRQVVWPLAAKSADLYLSDLGQPQPISQGTGAIAPAPISFTRMFGILASIIDGVLVGLVYGLAAMGLTLIWGVMDVINLTHGAMIVAGMFALYLLASALGIPPYLALPPVLIGGFFVGVALYWIAIHRMVGRPPLMSLLSTFAVNLVLIGVGTAVWGTALFNVEVSLPGVTIDRYTFPGAHILAAVLAAVIAAAALSVPSLHPARQGDARGGQ